MRVIPAWEREREFCAAGGWDRVAKMMPCRDFARNVAGCDRAVMCGDDRLTDGQADSHAAAAVRVGGRAGAIKDGRKLVLRDSDAVVTHVKGDISLVTGDKAVDRFFTPGVYDCIFKQVDDDLLDEHGIHWNHEKVIRYLYMDICIRYPFFQSDNGFGDNLLDRLCGLGHLCIGGIDACDGQNIFYHV